MPNTASSPLAAALSSVGDRWTLLIVEALIASVTKRLWKTARPRIEAIEALRQPRQH